MSSVATPSDAGGTMSPDVLLVDDHQLLAESLALLLRTRGLTARIATLGPLEGLVSQVWALRPRLVLLDLDLGGPVGDGVSLVRPFRDAGSAVLVLTGSSDQYWLGAALEHGAVGARSKGGCFDDLLADVLAAARGETVTPASARERAIAVTRHRRAQLREAASAFDRLTDREKQVLEALGEGRTVTEIAGGWVVSESTVRSQVRGVLTKLGVSSQLEAVTLALRTGWLSPPDLGYQGGAA